MGCYAVVAAVMVVAGSSNADNTCSDLVRDKGMGVGNKDAWEEEEHLFVVVVVVVVDNDEVQNSMDMDKPAEPRRNHAPAQI